MKGVVEVEKEDEDLAALLAKDDETIGAFSRSRQCPCPLSILLISIVLYRSKLKLLIELIEP